MTAWAIDAAAMLGLDAHWHSDPRVRAPLWSMTPSEVARRVLAQRDRDDAQARQAWHLHANGLAYSSATPESPVSAADVYPELFGPGMRWAMEPSAKAMDSAASMKATDDSVAAMVARMHANAPFPTA